MSNQIINSIKVSSKELPKYLSRVIEARLVPFIQSSPGMGKSDITHNLGNSYNLELIDLRLSQCDPVILNGLPSKQDQNKSLFTKIAYLVKDYIFNKGTVSDETKAMWVDHENPLLNDKISFLPMDFFPIEGDELPEGKDGWLLFLNFRASM